MSNIAYADWLELLSPEKSRQPEATPLRVLTLSVGQPDSPEFSFPEEKKAALNTNFHFMLKGVEVNLPQGVAARKKFFRAIYEWPDDTPIWSHLSSVELKLQYLLYFLLPAMHPFVLEHLTQESVRKMGEVEPKLKSDGVVSPADNCGPIAERFAYLMSSDEQLRSALSQKKVCQIYLHRSDKSLKVRTDGKALSQTLPKYRVPVLFITKPNHTMNVIDLGGSLQDPQALALGEGFRAEWLNTIIAERYYQIDASSGGLGTDFKIFLGQTNLPGIWTISQTSTNEGVIRVIAALRAEALGPISYTEVPTSIGNILFRELPTHFLNYESAPHFDKKGFSHVLNYLAAETLKTSSDREFIARQMQDLRQVSQSFEGFDESFLTQTLSSRARAILEGTAPDEGLASTQEGMFLGQLFKLIPRRLISDNNPGKEDMRKLMLSGIEELKQGTLSEAVRNEYVSILDEKFHKLRSVSPETKTAILSKVEALK